MEIERYLIIAIVFGSMFVGLFFYLATATSFGFVSRELLESFAVMFLCLAIGFGLAGLVKAITNRK